MANAFERALGARQGRLTPSGFEQTDDFAFVIGSDTPGYFEDLHESVVVDTVPFDIPGLSAGDLGEVTQSVDLTGINFIRARINLRNSDVLPANINWEASITINGGKESTMLVEAGRTRERANMAANVSKLSGAHTVGFRLEMVAV